MNSTITSTSKLEKEENHSTNKFNFKLNLNNESNKSWNSFEIDLLDSNLWLETFLLNVQTVNNNRIGGKIQRLAVTELMKTPGRKRTTTTNNNTTNQQTTTNKKDSIATILFPTAPPLTQTKSLPITTTTTSSTSNLLSNHRTTPNKFDKENTNNISRIPSPSSVKKLPFSPNSKGKGKAIMTLMSPLRDSPARSILKPSSSTTPTAVVKVLVEISPTKIIVQPEEKQQDEILIEEEVVAEEEELTTPIESIELEIDEEKANLSMIGEEEEIEESQISTSTTSTSNNLNNTFNNSSFINNNNNTSIVLPETQFQFQQPTRSISSVSTINLSPPPPPPPSNTSNVEDETVVPINDAPSTLRNPLLSSSLPASSSSNNNNTTRTPGGTTSTISRSFAPSSYSAHKLTNNTTTGGGILSSSPPQSSSHISISSILSGGGGTTNNSRSSGINGGVGGRIQGGPTPTLNFVGLPKKSLGLGMSFGRNLGGVNSSSENNLGQSTSTSSTATTNVGSSSNNKRKSLTGPDLPNKSIKTIEPLIPLGGGGVNTTELASAAGTTSRLLSRVQAMTANQKRVSSVNLVGANNNINNNNIVNSSGSGSSINHRQSWTIGNGVGGIVGKPLTLTSSVNNGFMGLNQIGGQNTTTTPINEPSTFISSPNSKSLLLPSTTSTSSFNPTMSISNSQPFKPIHPSLQSASKLLPSTSSSSLQIQSRTNSVTSLVNAFESNDPSLHTTTNITSPSKLPLPSSPSTRSPSKFLNQINLLGKLQSSTTAFAGGAGGIGGGMLSPNSNLAGTNLAPRMFMRSPTFKSGLSIGNNSNNSTTNGNGNINNYSTTPKGSPKFKSSTISSLHSSKFVLKALETATEEEEEEEEEELEVEELLIREVLTSSKSIHQLDELDEDEIEEEEENSMDLETDEVEKLLREKEIINNNSLDLSLPAVLKEDYEEADEEEEEEESDQSRVNSKNGQEMVVEKGRGALACALDFGSKSLNSNQFEVIVVPQQTSQILQSKNESTTSSSSAVGVINKPFVSLSPKKILMPGGLILEDEEESIEVDENLGDDENDLSVEIIEVVKKVPTGLVRKASTISMNGSRPSTNTNTNANGGSNSMFKSGTNGVPKVKSIQLAAAAAKKEQQEKERKLALKEERENIRLATIQRKQEEERIKLEDEKRLRAEGEKKRKERDGLATSQGAGASSKSKVIRPKDRAPEEEQGGKKRKVDQPEIKRIEIKKLINGSSSSSNNNNTTAPLRTVPSNSNLHASLNSSTGRSVLAPHHNKSTTSTTTTATSGSSMIGVKYMNNVPGFSGNGNGVPRIINPILKNNNNNNNNGGTVASTSNSNSNSQNNKPRPTQPKSEENYPELPDIESEYSDSGDEGYEEKAAARPSWAQSPNLAVALYRQAHVNPDDIFGPIPTLQMNEIFKTNSSRITKRTSSACWEGSDALTAADEANYNRQMGFQPRRPSTLRK